MLRALFAFLAIHCGLLTENAAAERPPNIVLLLADDLSYEAIGAAGLIEIETPHLDRLAKRGTAFTHAYNMGSWSGAVCVASRAMLITGRSLWNAREVHGTMDAERQVGRLWPQLMRKAGYQTYFTGKWHIPVDPAQCFDVVRHVRGAMPGDAPEGYGRPLPGVPDSWDPSDPRFGGYWEGGKHWTEVVSDEAVSFITDASRTSSPFFLYAAFNAPHDPRQSPRAYVDKYPLDRIQVPRNFLAEYPFKDAIGCAGTLRDEALAPFPRTEYAVKVHRQEYYASISHLDAQIGRILAALEASGEAERTWIFFTADHGLAVGHHGLFGKQNMYEHSLRVPFFVAGPGVPRNRRLDMPVYLQDVMPTTLALAGIDQPKHVYFHNLLPLLHGTTTTSPYSSIYGAYLNLQRAVIHDGYKLIVYPRVRRTRLYQLTNDPDEMHDLALDPALAETQRRLFDRLFAMQAELGDGLDLRPAPRPRGALP
ncbi:MAG: sulfatase-like hydrolase/transferase [Planctomycetia bacterium]|nr:sulfatase-like hydrolase/transferase [Planctomycetia bacterium]